MAPVSSLPTPLSRKTSSTTGLSFLSSDLLSGNCKKLYIFIHGWACSARDFKPLISALSKSSLGPETLFVAPDLPGHGNTPRSVCPAPTVSAYAHLINDLRHELSPTNDVPTTIIGHSMGCRIGLETVSQQPANVTGIGLLDGSWYGPTPKDYKPISRNNAEELQNVLEVFNTMLGPTTPEYFKVQIQDHLKEVDLDYVNELRRDYIAWDGRRMDEVLRTLGSRTDHGTRVLVVQGTEGHGVKRKALKKGEEGPWMQFVKTEVEDRYTGIIVEGSGHWPHVDKVLEVADVIQTFGQAN